MTDFLKILDVQNSQTEVDKFSITYQKDNGQLTEKQIEALRADAQNHLPSGQVLSKVYLFELT
jgi:hypothetical protein